MEWQDYTVWAIVAAMLVLVLRRAVSLLSGRRRGGCSSCSDADCPMKKRKG